jgi:hypothetical protein
MLVINSYVKVDGGGDRKADSVRRRGAAQKVFQSTEKIRKLPRNQFQWAEGRHLKHTLVSRNNFNREEADPFRVLVRSGSVVKLSHRLPTSVHVQLKADFLVFEFAVERPPTIIE